MRKYRTCFVFGLLSVYAAMAQAQTPDTPPGGQSPAATSVPQVTPAPVDPGILHRWGTDFSFLFDGYLDTNFNSPASGFNGLRAFDIRSDTAHFMLGMITIDHAPAPFGFHLDAGFGEMFHIVHAGTRDPRAWDYIKQAYVSFKPKALHGVEIDAGEFVTSAGAEVIETNQNYNYSRSLLFTWAIAYTHTGVRAQYALGSHFTGNVQVVNGWNNVEPLNRGKTLGFNGAYAWKKATWSQTYYVGPEHPGTTKGWRNLYDTNLTVNQTDNLTWYLAFDYGRDKNIGPGEYLDGRRLRRALRHREKIRDSLTPGVFRRCQWIYYRDRANGERIHSNPGIQVDELALFAGGIPHRLVEQALLRKE